jgi:hypothetical protein
MSAGEGEAGGRLSRNERPNLTRRRSLGSPSGDFSRTEIVGNLPGLSLTSEEDFCPRQGGRIQWVRWSMKPWPAADSRIVGVLLFAGVITDQVTATRALTDSETAVPGHVRECTNRYCSYRV